MDSFIADLADERAPGLWNMYHQTDPKLDSTGATYHRQHNLLQYLEARVGAKYALIGLAPGYAGARFSGEPFNDELHVFEKTGIRLSQRFNPWREDTSGVVQKSLERLAIMDDTVSWNALPFHPFMPGKHTVNRTPDRHEIDEFGLPWLSRFLRLIRPGTVIPVGRVAEDALKTLVDRGMTDLNLAGYIRHPSHGGATLFFRGLHTVVTGGLGAKEEQPGKAGG